MQGQQWLVEVFRMSEDVLRASSIVLALRNSVKCQPHQPHQPFAVIYIRCLPYIDLAALSSRPAFREVGSLSESPFANMLGTGIISQMDLSSVTTFFSL